MFRCRLVWWTCLACGPFVYLNHFHFVVFRFIIIIPFRWNKNICEEQRGEREKKNSKNTARAHAGAEYECVFMATLLLFGISLAGQIEHSKPWFICQGLIYIEFRRLDTHTLTLWPNEGLPNHRTNLLKIHTIGSAIILCRCRLNRRLWRILLFLSARNKSNKASKSINFKLKFNPLVVHVIDFQLVLNFCRFDLMLNDSRNLSNWLGKSLDDMCRCGITTYFDLTLITGFSCNYEMKHCCIRTSARAHSSGPSARPLEQMPRQIASISNWAHWGELSMVDERKHIVDAKINLSNQMHHAQHLRSTIKLDTINRIETWPWWSDVAFWKLFCYSRLSLSLTLGCFVRRSMCVPLFSTFDLWNGLFVKSTLSLAAHI